ncbi:MAG: aspartate 1-decarboxylase [Planctomycetota bacterium]|jgi:aspartate 1-decarboxylase
MLRKILRAKIHRATVTQADPDYIGSITIDRDLIDAVGLAVGECVLVADIDNGNRFETYVFEGERGSGVICLNGAAAKLVSVGDKIIIIAFGYVEDDQAASVNPRVILVDDANRLSRTL